MTGFNGSPPRERKVHACAAVWFLKSLPIDRSPIECRCGWLGVLEDWPAHGPALAVSRAWNDEAPSPREPRPEGPSHCPQGHEYTTQNSYVNPSGARQCRACRRIRAARYYGARRATPGTRAVAA